MKEVDLTTINVVSLVTILYAPLFVAILNGGHLSFDMSAFVWIVSLSLFVMFHQVRFIGSRAA